MLLCGIATRDEKTAEHGIHVIIRRWSDQIGGLSKSFNTLQDEINLLLSYVKLQILRAFPWWPACHWLLKKVEEILERFDFNNSSYFSLRSSWVDATSLLKTSRRGTQNTSALGKFMFESSCAVAIFVLSCLKTSWDDSLSQKIWRANGTERFLFEQFCWFFGWFSVAYVGWKLQAFIMRHKAVRKEDTELMLRYFIHHNSHFPSSYLPCTMLLSRM